MSDSTLPSLGYTRLASFSERLYTLGLGIFVIAFILHIIGIVCILNIWYISLTIFTYKKGVAWRVIFMSLWCNFGSLLCMWERDGVCLRMGQG